MKNSIHITDFTFRFAGHGHYLVTFESRKTGKQFKALTNDMPLIDATKNAEYPKIKDLNQLKKLCKQ